MKSLRRLKRSWDDPRGWVVKRSLKVLLSIERVERKTKEVLA